MVNFGDQDRASRGRWLPPAAIVLLTLALYANSIGNGYAVDDDRMIEDHPQAMRGIAAIPEILTTNFLREKGRGASFRPLVRIIYAVEVQLFGANPHAHHAVQTVLYALTGLAVYGLILALFPHGPPLLALVTALLFVAHPVHTEVVNNLKGRDELLTFLFGLLSALACLRYYRSGARGPLVLGAGLFLAALCCKESGHQYLATVPLVAWFGGSWNGRRLAIVVASLLAAAILYWGYYFAVLDRDHILYMATTTAGFSFMEHPLMFVDDPSVRYGTAFLSIGFYLRLLLFPHPLSFFYGLGAVPLVPITNPEAWIPALAYAGIAWIGWHGLRRRTILSFAAIWFLATSAMFTNLIVPMSGIVADRYIYSASLGFCLALAYALTRGFANASSRYVRAGIGLITLLVLAGYSAKTVSRNPAWESRQTLADADVRSYPDAALIRAFRIRLAWKDLAAAAEGPDRRMMAERLIRETEDLATVLPAFRRKAAKLKGDVHLAYLDDPRRAIESYEQALNLVVAAGDPVWESDGIRIRTSEILLGIARARLNLGEEEAARIAFRRALDSYRTEEPTAPPIEVDLDAMPTAAAIERVNQLIAGQDG